MPPGQFKRLTEVKQETLAKVRQTATSKMGGRRALAPLVLFAVLIFLLLSYLYYPYALSEKVAPKLIAHRGVHQTFPLDNLAWNTCTAAIIDPPRHPFLENTIPSMRAAFRAGANAVEIDIHPTADRKLAVFHDWTLGCRTDGKGETHKRRLIYLQTLDVGYGYIANAGRTYPFRGKGRGMIPSFPEVLEAFPGRTIAVNQKDTFRCTPLLIAEALRRLPNPQRPHLYYLGDEKTFALLKQKMPIVTKPLPTRSEEKACAPAYLAMLFTAKIAPECGQWGIGVPSRYLRFIPGWPRLFLKRAAQAGLKVWVVDVDTLKAWERVKGLPIDGIVTNRIEIIGPRVKAGAG